jgi:hypothetical protein
MIFYISTPPSLARLFQNFELLMERVVNPTTLESTYIRFKAMFFIYSFDFFFTPPRLETALKIMLEFILTLLLLKVPNA